MIMKAIPAFRLMEAAEFIDQSVHQQQTDFGVLRRSGGSGRPRVVVAYLCSKGMRFGQAVEFVAMRENRI